MKLCSRLLMFFVDIYAKNVKCGYLNPILGKSGVTNDLGWWLIGKPGSIRLNWTFFAICYGSGVMRRSMYSWAVFAGVDLFVLEIDTDRVVLINHSWRQKTRDTGLPDGEDRIPLRSVVLTQYRSVTDRRTDLPYTYTPLAKLCFAKRCKKGK